MPRNATVMEMGAKTTQAKGTVLKQRWTVSVNEFVCSNNDDDNNNNNNNNSNSNIK